jgi:hypothetical protein
MQSSVRTPQETHYVSATKPNRLMIFRKIIAVYCENHTEHRKLDAAKTFLGGRGNVKLLLLADIQGSLKIIFRIEEYIFRIIYVVFLVYVFNIFCSLLNFDFLNPGEEKSLACPSPACAHELCGQKVDFLNLNIRGTYTNHWH